MLQSNYQIRPISAYNDTNSLPATQIIAMYYVADFHGNLSNKSKFDQDRTKIRPSVRRFKEV